jgi:hypothetical protein
MQSGGPRHLERRSSGCSRELRTRGNEPKRGRLLRRAGGKPRAAPFDLIADKDFDRSVVTGLNERLPLGASGKFAAFFDGSAYFDFQEMACTKTVASKRGCRTRWAGPSCESLGFHIV